jgi:hypothetical protein
LATTDQPFGDFVSQGETDETPLSLMSQVYRGGAAQRNIPVMLRAGRLRFRSAGARKSFLSRVFYKHLAPNGAKQECALALLS